MKSQKKVYWVVSGTLMRGSWERVELTEIGLKRFLVKVRSSGRWARACFNGFCVESGVRCYPPKEILNA